jgi:hypothetical protein
MAVSDTARRILAEAAQHPPRLAAPPNKLPTAACRAVLNNLLKQGYVEKCVASDEFAGLRWHQPGWYPACGAHHRSRDGSHRRHAGHHRSRAR